MIHDLMLAAQAQRLVAVLVTHNTAGFARVQNLTVEVWQRQLGDQSINDRLHEVLDIYPFVCIGVGAEKIG